MMKRPFLSSIAVISLFALAACSEQGEQAQAAQGAQQMPPQAVSVAQVKRQAVEQSMSLPGRITPFRQSQVRPQVDGVITQRLFEEGAKVEKGQQLYQIDDARFEAQLNSAKADLQSAEANLATMDAKAKRYKDLVARNAVSQQEYDDVIAQTKQARAAISVAQAAVDLAQVNLGYTKVYAPISGQISRSYVTEGALVTTNQAQQLAIITQLDPVYVDMQESGKAILNLRNKMQGKKALPVELVIDETTRETYPHRGEVKFSEVTVEQTTGSVALRAIVPNPDGLLMPGLFVNAKVITGDEPALLVPQRATMRQPDGSLSVYVVKGDNTVEPRTLETMGAFESQYLVKSGVKEGETIIVVGYQKVRPGAKVTPQPWDGGQGSSNSQAQN